MARRDQTATCALTGEVKPCHQMLRFVADPNSQVVVDIRAELPGPDFWTVASSSQLEAALSDGRFLKAAEVALGDKVAIAAEANAFVAVIDGLLSRQCLARLGLMRAAGQLIAGQEKVSAILATGTVQMLIEASDASPDSIAKMRAKARGVLAEMAELAADSEEGEEMPSKNVGLQVMNLFDRDQLSEATGLGNLVHGAICDARVSQAFSDEVLRLGAFRGKPLPELAKKG